MTSTRLRTRGQAMAEFALVFPIFALLLFGIIDLGRYVATANSLSNGAREAARAASVGLRPSPQCDGLSRKDCAESVADSNAWFVAPAAIDHDSHLRPRSREQRSRPSAPTTPVTPVSGCRSNDLLTVHSATTFSLVTPLIAQFIGDLDHLGRNPGRGEPMTSRTRRLPHNGGPNMASRRPLGRRSERGQILVIAAGGMLGLLAIAALVLEGGTMLLNRRDGQNAADLSSVAGAHVIAQSYTAGAKTQADVWDAIEANLDQNDCGPTGSAPCAWTATFVAAPASGTGLVDLGPVNNTSSALPAYTLGVRVDVTRSPGAILGRVIGRDHWDVSVEGTAITQKTVGGAGTLLPIAVCGWKVATDAPCQRAEVAPLNAFRYVPGQLYDLTDGKDAPGGFGWLSWTGSNAAGALAASICTPNNPDFTLDDPFDDPGAYGGTYRHEPGDWRDLVPDRPGQVERELRPGVSRWLGEQPRDRPRPDLRHGDGQRQQRRLPHHRRRRLPARVAQPARDRQHPRHVPGVLPAHGRARRFLASTGRRRLDLLRRTGPVTLARSEGREPGR